MSMMDKMTDRLSAVAAVCDGNKHLSVIKNTFVGTMGFVIVGSFATLFNTILCSTSTGLAKVSVFAWLAALSPVFSTVNYVTMNLLALMVAVLMGYLYGQKNHVNEMTSMLTCLTTYLSVSPLSTTVKNGDAVAEVSKVLPSCSTDSEALFTAIIISILASEILFRLTKIEQIKIKMPEQVPANIATMFNNLIPVAITLFGIATGIRCKGRNWYVSYKYYLHSGSGSPSGGCQYSIWCCSLDFYLTAFLVCRYSWKSANRAIEKPDYRGGFGD
ncbi:MAG: PTS sugar transporter subunit IIC [Hungatella sp.]|nr:PTS sugar transporter subunit IIC [Hungatella sp.]